MKTPSTPTPENDKADPVKEDPALQGEGNYTAARRHRASVKKFVQAGRVEDAAQDAAPRSAAEADALQAAEQAGLSHARR